MYKLEVTKHETHAFVHSFHGYLLNTYNAHYSWCEDKAMNMSGKTVPAWSLHAREMEKQTKNVQLLQ